MAWSTRELAELAGTSVRTVRHYHEVGLLEEPERSSNGYKHYGVAHLLRLLHIKRLTELGFSLSQIAAMGDDGAHPEQAVRALDAELAATIERLQRARREIAVILRHSAPTDLPVDLARSTADLPDADRAFVTVASKALDPPVFEAYEQIRQGFGEIPGAHELAELPADADETTRRELAERLFPAIAAAWAEHPQLSGHRIAPSTVQRAAQAFEVAIDELYNPAQADVFRRVQDMFRAAP